MSHTPKTAANSGSGFINFLLGLFSGMQSGTELEREKKRRLKELERELKKRGRYYRVKSDQALPNLAKWFYDIYKVTGPADILLEKYGNSEILKTVIIESFLPEEIRGAIETLTPDNIREKVNQEKDINTVAETVRETLVRLHSALDADTIKRINKLYNDLHGLQIFCKFPFQFLLKKFDSKLPERNFTYSPQFEAINGQYIKNDLMEFLDVYYALDGNAEWKLLFSTLKTYRDTNFIHPVAWKKILTGRMEMMKSRTLELIVRHLQEDPHWAPIPEKTNHEIAENYFNRIKTDAEQTIQELISERRTKKIEHLLLKLFGTTSINRTQHYVERENLTYHKKSLAGYTLVDPINYLKAFFLDFYKGRIRVLVDLLLIQGKWVTTISSQQFSESYHQLLAVSEELMAFDADLSDDGETGTRLKRLLRQSSRDRSALVSLKNALQKVNTEAMEIIHASSQHLIALGKGLKQLHDEYRVQGIEIIINWKELDSRVETPLNDQLTAVYAQIFYLIQLLQYYIKA